MFGRRFFGGRFFGARYFGGGGTSTPVLLSQSRFAVPEAWFADPGWAAVFDRRGAPVGPDAPAAPPPPPPPGTDGTHFGNRFFGPRFFGPRFWGTTATPISVVDGAFFGNRFFGPRFFGPRFWGTNAAPLPVALPGGPSADVYPWLARRRQWWAALPQAQRPVPLLVTAPPLPTAAPVPSAPPLGRRLQTAGRRRPAPGAPTR